MTLYFLAAFAISACSITIARSPIFRPVRKQLPSNLLNCHYCVSHWISFALCCWWFPLSTIEEIITVAVMSFALVGGSAVISGFILFFTPFQDE